MVQCITLQGAYGRRYKEPSKALKDWKDGKDFIIVLGPYCSIRDLPDLKRMSNEIVIRCDDGSIIKL